MAEGRLKKELADVQKDPDGTSGVTAHPAEEGLSIIDFFFSC